MHVLGMLVSCVAMFMLWCGIYLAEPGSAIQAFDFCVCGVNLFNGLSCLKNV